MKIRVHYYKNPDVDYSTFHKVKDYTYSLDNNFIKINDENHDVHIINLSHTRLVSVIKNG